MNEKGFATIFGLCLILAIALVVKGIQESEMNHAYETSDFQTEFELQNLADSGIYRAVDEIKKKKILCPIIGDTRLWVVRTLKEVVLATMVNSN